MTGTGTSFKLYKNHKYIYTYTTKLVGEYNIQNLILVIALAKNLGLTDKSIAYALDSIVSVTARMEETKKSNGGIIINNGYNSNIDSVKETIKVLNLYKDKTKIVITPGLIELGKYQYQYNFDLGAICAKYADIIYVVGKLNKRAITKGVESIGGDTKVMYLLDKQERNKILNNIKGNEVILLENDLPSNYEV